MTKLFEVHIVTPLGESYEFDIEARTVASARLKALERFNRELNVSVDEPQVSPAPTTGGIGR